jgi:isoamylase
LLFFDGEDDARPARVIDMDLWANRAHCYWHAFVSGVKTGRIYGYRVEGRSDPASGMRFDLSKILLDP